MRKPFGAPVPVLARNEVIVDPNAPGMSWEISDKTRAELERLDREFLMHAIRFQEYSRRFPWF